MTGGLIMIGCGIAVALFAIFADAFAGFVLHRVRMRAALEELRK